MLSHIIQLTCGKRTGGMVMSFFGATRNGWDISTDVSSSSSSIVGFSVSFPSVSIPLASVNFLQNSVSSANDLLLEGSVTVGAFPTRS